MLQAFHRTQLTAGSNVLVMGAGAVGLLACAAAKAHGARYVAAIDIDSHRLGICKANGWADDVHCLPRQQSSLQYDSRKEEDVAVIEASKQQASVTLDQFAALSSIDTLSSGFDIVYECTGVPSCINISMFSCKSGGKVGLIGMGNPIVTMALGSAALREVDIIGVFRYANMFEKAVELLSTPLFRENEAGGKIQSIFSHHLPLSETAEAFGTLARGHSEDGERVIKVLITHD